MKTESEIAELIGQKNFSSAEKALVEVVTAEPQLGWPHYFLGCIYGDYQFPKRSVEKAKTFFTKSINSSTPVEDAFVQLAFLEKNKAHSRRIIQHGIRSFPKSESLYQALFRYTDLAEREELFSEFKLLDIKSAGVHRSMVNTYIELGRFDLALAVLGELQQEDDGAEFLPNLLKAMCLLRLDRDSEAKILLEWLVENDVSHYLNYAPEFGLVIFYLKKNDRSNALKIFTSVPEEEDFGCPLDIEYGPVFIVYSWYVNEAIEKLLSISSDQSVLAKARGIRALVAINLHDLGGSEIKRREVIADLRAANKYFKSNTKYCSQLIAFANEDKRYFEEHLYAVQYLCNSLYENNDAFDSVDYAYVGAATAEEFEQIYLNVLSGVQSDNYSESRVLPQGPCPAIVTRLCEEKAYEKVVAIADALGEKLFTIPQLLFRSAYSYAEIGKVESAVRCYEEDLEHHEWSHGAINNLGVLLEEDGKFEKAKKHYQKALNRDKTSTRYKSNLDRILKAEKAANNFEVEDVQIKQQLLAVWNERDFDGYITNAVSAISKSLNKSQAESNKIVNSMAENRYLLPVDSKKHDYGDQVTVYRVNPYIVDDMEAIQAEVNRNNDLVALAREITPESLDAIGFNEPLTLELRQKIRTFELQQLLQRDLREAAFALVTKSYKSTLVLSGSIIEAILLDRVMARGLSKYKLEDGKVKSVMRMDLGDLLFVAASERLIDRQLFHLAQALRDFRNLIHPGLEQRKSGVAVSEQNAKISWDILRKLIKEI